jgi:hypothetical protein
MLWRQSAPLSAAADRCLPVLREAETALWPRIGPLGHPSTRHDLALRAASERLTIWIRGATYWIDSNAWNPRLRLAMMASGSARQMNGLAPSLLCSATKLLMAVWRSTTEQNTPCLRRRRLSVAKKPSKAFSHELEVGVKGKVRRGWRSSHARTFLNRPGFAGGSNS